MNVIASRSFTVEDQAAFAAFSGDHNPMHMDPVAARRTQAGAPVVHGVHTLLWALDQLAASGLPFTNLATIAVQFSRFVYLNQAVTLTLPRRDDRSATAELVRDGLTLSTISLRFGPRADKDLPPNLLEAPDTIVADPLPNAPSLDDIATLRGWMPPVSAPISAHAIAPSLIEAIGLPRVRGFGLLSRLVGMICPGMHSIFTGIRVDLVSRAPDRAGVGFAVGVLDQRFRVARINVAGDGLLGTITAAVRWPPVETPALATLASHVTPGRFAGSSALVVGGSRGLGALTAKLLAIGGARVIVTYATGKDDAASLATDLNGAFGPDTCRTLQFDVLADLPPPTRVTAASGRSAVLFRDDPDISAETGAVRPCPVCGIQPCICRCVSRAVRSSAGGRAKSHRLLSIHRVRRGSARADDGIRDVEGSGGGPVRRYGAPPARPESRGGAVAAYADRSDGVDNAGRDGGSSGGHAAVD